MEVVVRVPAPALRRLVEGREGAVVVVAVVTGRGLGRLAVVVGRVCAAVVVGAVVMVGGGGGGAVVVVVAGAVPVPATGGNVNAFKASSTLTG